MDYLTNLLGAFAVAVSDLQGMAVDCRERPRADSEALLAIHARPGSTVGDIAATTGLTHSGAVRVADRLSRLGFVERTPGLDRRTVVLRCTASGAEEASGLLSLRQKALHDLIEGLSADDAACLRRIAEDLLSQLPKRRSDAWRICRLCDHGVCDESVCPVGRAVS